MTRWEEGYDCGYYEALRNAIRYIIMQQSMPLDEIIAALAEMRDDAHAQHRETSLKYGDEE